MLRLLAQREQGYDDIAALMGLSVDEVRSRVRDALDQLEAEGEPLPPVPEPEPAPPEPPAPEPEPPAEPVSPPPPPPTPTEPVATEAPSPGAPPSPPQRPQVKLSMPSDSGPRAAIVAGALVLVALVVILIVGGGDDSGSANTAAEGNTPVAEGGEGERTGAVLEPVNGSGASGEANFGRVGESLALQLNVQGLEPTGKNRNYTIWIAQSPRRMLPLTSTRVGKSGKIEGQFEVPVEVLEYLAAGTFDQLAITRTEDAKLQASLEKASKESKEPSYTGTEVLRGTITGPIVGAAAREEEASAE